MALPVVVFNYKISDLFEEVTKRTSYMGKMRSTEQEPYLVDRMSLDSGEDFMFREFLEEAVHETYDWVKAFGRNIPIYEKIVNKYEDVVQYKNYGVEAKNFVTGDSIEINKTIKMDNYSVGKFNDDFLEVTHDAIVAEFGLYKEDVKVTIERKIILHTDLEGLNVTTEINHTEYSVITSKTRNCSFDVCYPPFSFIESGSLHTIVSAELYVTLKVEPISSTVIKKGTYVEHRTNFSDDSVFDVYKVNVDCTTADWLENSTKLDYDPRGCVVYVLERASHIDFNMIQSTDRNIYEAIINRIIYLWFEYVNAPEAEKYLLKFEDYGHKAQLCMNTRTKDIQRKYKLF